MKGDRQENFLYRAAESQVDRFLASYSLSSRDPESVHQMRILTKKLRAYLALYPKGCRHQVKSVGRDLKKMADSVSKHRDFHVLEDTIRLLADGVSEEQSQCLKGLIEGIKGESRPPDTGISDRPVTRALESLLESWPQYPIPQHQMIEGFWRLYSKAGKRGTKAVERNRDEHFHKWRKWVKQLYYCHPLLPGEVLITVSRPALKDLGESLGKYHDINVLENYLENAAPQRVAPEAALLVANVIAARKVAFKKFFSKACREIFYPEK